MDLSRALKNASFAKQLAAFLCCALLCFALAASFSGIEAAWWSLASSLAACVVFTAFTARRYREIRQLASEVDEVLHGGRRICFSTCVEGDVAVLRNELSKMVAQLRKTTELLSREKALLAESMADISHQIRTPMTALALKLDALRYSADERARRRLVRDMEMLVERVSWLVSSLLKMAKADAGALAVEKRDVEAARAVERAFGPLEALFDLRDVSFGLACDGGGRFLGDERWTAEALGNIMKNCLEHTPAGGAVSVSVSEDALATRIVVEDTGCGIAPEDLPHVFERFYRGSSREGVVEGFGIGLSLAQSLVDAQGGVLRVDNGVSGGARFEIAFPKVVV